MSREPPGEPTKKVAWGDESARTTADPPMYLMAASILLGGASATRSLEALLPRGAKKLHWREMGTKLQAESMSMIARLDHSTTIVIAAPIDTRKTERARRKCLEAMLPALEAKGVESLVLESRGTERDRNDIRFIDGIRQRSLIKGIRVEHRSPEGEPRLWVPDQALGAVGDAHALPTHPQAWTDAWQSLKNFIEVVEIKP